MCKLRPIAMWGLAILASLGAAGPVAAENLQRAEVASAWDLSGLRNLVTQISQEHGMDPRLIDAVVRVESGYNIRAISHKGAMGLMQLMPATARRLRVLDPFDPEQNIRGGVREVSRLVERYAGNFALALAAYNAGEGAVQKYRGIPPYRETQNYVRKVMSIYTGRPYSLGKTYKRKATVRISRDPSTGRAIISNQGTASSRGSSPGSSGSSLGGGFGK